MTEYTITPERQAEAERLSAAVREQNLRSQFMDFLYATSGRTSGHYTGLWQELKEAGLDRLAQHIAETTRTEWGTTNYMN